MPSRNLARLTLAAVGLLVLVGCEVRTSVKLAGGPSFLFDGSGRLVFLRIYVPDRDVRSRLLLMTSRLCGVSRQRAILLLGL
jgi:hypothetical protein